MANPPFNLKAWRAADELTDDPRWNGYEVPPAGNANYAWILHIISKLSENGVAGFVLANGSMSTNTSGEGLIRQKIIENDLVDCMIALPGQLFYTTQIPVCLWFLTRNKKAKVVEGHSESNRRDRQGETLFIDARNMGTMIDRTHKELTCDDISRIAGTYHAWRGEAKGGTYQDQPGFCKAVTLEEIKANDYVLTPGRYVGAAEIEDDGILFEKKMAELSRTLYRQMEESEKLDAMIRENLEALVMGGEWQEARLTDLYDISSGISKPAKEFGSGDPFLSFKDVFYNFFVPDELSQLVQSSKKEQEKCSIRCGDVFLTRTSETMNDLGMSCVALKDYDKATFNGFTKRLRPKSNTTLHPEYVAYYLRSPKFRSEMLAFSTMSTRASLNIEMVSHLKISIPPILEQKSIAWILKKIDDKIELNRQMNSTLESMA